MRLKRLEVQNWRNHQSRVVNFGSITQIRGHNGSGKTSLVDAIVFALTGLVRNSDNRDEEICVNPVADGHCYVILEFEHNSNNVRIFRAIAPKDSKTRLVNKQFLTINDESYSKATDIKDQLQRILGVDDDIIAKYLFVAQWEIFSFITATDSELSKTFDRLFGLDKAETIWTELGKAVIPDAKISVDGDKVKSELTEAENRINVLQGKIAELNNGLFGNVQADKQLVASYEDYLRDKSRFVLAGSELADLQKTLTAAKEKQGLVEIKLQQCLAVYNASLKPVATYRKAIQTYQQIEQSSALHQKQKARYEEFLTRLEELKKQEPVEPAGYVDKQGRKLLQALLSNLTSEQYTINEFLKLKQYTECPTCGSQIEDNSFIQTKIKRFQDRLFVIEQDIATTTEKISTCDKFDDHKQNFLIKREKIESVLQELKSAIDNIPTFTTPDVTKAHAESYIRDFEQLEVTLKDLRSRSTVGENTIVNLESMVKKYNSIVEPGEPVSKDQYLQAKTNIERIESWTKERDQLSLQLELQERLLENNRALYDRFLDESKKSQCAVMVDQDLTALRDIFYRSNLPRAVLVQRFEELKLSINELLEAFGSRFRVASVGSDLRFTIRFNNNTLQPARRLSGGEKTILAIAFRISLNALFAAEIGILCLDEPTAGLDENSIRCVEIAFQHLRKLSNNLGLQVLLITHEKLLDNVCDVVVDLSNGISAGV